jgi:hypothetical protein
MLLVVKVLAQQELEARVLLVQLIQVLEAVVLIKTLLLLEVQA